ncbi:Di-copper centre-containing protein [Ophiobolus disseminans]|uniref:tyrosinase n=1 Tax=Ophiobolus disseminans TaxID=1469910 RepID=A0A6A7AGA7_9PLEO|nr:Di-copper centre-containing protein [Ophiobolus disseminans]
MPRLWFVQIVLQLLFVLFAACTPVTAAGPHRTLEQRQSRNGVVTGVGWRDANGNVPVRREVRDLQANFPEQWSLYLLALSALQWADQSDSRSYYALASIHGRPYRTWENVPGLEGRIGTASYCPHGNILFMGWHRPYLALFEEEVYKQVQAYAAEARGDSAERWRSAANSFRIPYWDWAKSNDGSSVPESFTQERIEVTRASGGRHTIWNPLYAFYFHPLIPADFESKWSHLNSTQRWPTSDGSDSRSNQGRMAEVYGAQRRNLHDHVDRAFRQSSINRFANTVEEAHGWIHGVVGGGWEGNGTYKGHMWPLEYSAFDPLFMLHHTNVDRLLAMYQAAHPDIYFTAENIGLTGNVFLLDNTNVDANTELLPFRKASGGFWTMNDARNTTTLGYAYPETTRVGQMSVAEHTDAVKASIAQLYGSSARGMLAAQPVTASGRLVLAGDGKFTDWAIDTKAMSNDLPPSFVVRFSLVGDFSSDQTFDVGSWVKLTHSSHEGSMDKRAATIQKTYEGSVSLTAALIDQVAAGKLESLDSKDVVPFLKDKLTWKVLTGEGNPIPQKQFDPFTFEVVSSEAHIPNSPSAAIEYSEKVARYPEVTVNKAGGVVI